ncbi:uncharacterized protein zgc:66455 [Leucoraja erinacea]|uniref:uncharacterized protein zgc:66455 n=1 Tax=Leucoraja erinaceus TaxID=7782 RepID=UPI0024569342|nr:uncharacterized protein zgc:66455 [Leucoraja erinacea]
MERRIGRSIKRLVIEKLSTFSSFKELFLLTIKSVDAPGLLFVYWLYFSPGAEDIYILIESRLKQLVSKSVSNLRYGKAEIFLISIEDVDECTSGLSTCDPEATCLNAFGLYSCRCPKGFEVSSGIGCAKNVKSESGFVSPLGLQEILASVILCVVLVLAIMLMLLFMIKRKNKRILARNQSSDDFLPRQQTLLPQEEMRLEESLFEFDGTQNNRIFFKNSEPVEVVIGRGDCMGFKMVQKQRSVESPHL